MPSTTVARTQPDVVVPQTIDGVDAERAEAVVQVGAEERRGLLLLEHDVAGGRGDERIDVAAVRAAQAGHEPGALDAERAGVREIRLVGAVGVGHGRARARARRRRCAPSSAARPRGSRPRAGRA